MQIGLGLWLGTRQVSGASGPFDPASLFAAGEQGGWYDPSNLTTMFQDINGLLPVSATGQTVAILLDKSQGLAFGAEVVTNGDFSSGSTGWTAPLAGASITGGALVFDGVTSIAAGPPITTNTPTSTIAAGKVYQVTYTIIGGTTLPVSVTVGAGVATARTAAGTYTEYVVAVNTSAPVIVARISTGARTGSIDNISIREVLGNHLTQTTAASRPQYQIDANGLPFLLFDGTDDWFVSPTITPGTNKAQVFAGVRKLAETSGMLLESSTSAQSNQGSFLFRAPSSATANYSVSSGGTSLIGATATASGYPAPITNVVSFQSDIAGPSLVLRVNNAQVASSVTSQGTGNFNAYPLYVGRRGGTTTPFNGRVYQMIVRFGANLDAATITATETFVNSKTGAY